MRSKITLFVLTASAVCALAWLSLETSFFRSELPADNRHNNTDEAPGESSAVAQATARVLPRVVAAPKDCDLHLNFHGQPDDFVRVEYWQQRLTELFAAENLASLDSLAEPSPLRFCASLHFDVYSDNCPEQAGRAWCRPLPQSNSSANKDSLARLISESRAPASAAESAPLQTTKATDISVKPQFDIVLADTGLANTRNGVVFLQRTASVHVLKHEFGHALGLADEYPMHSELARQFCNGEFNFTANNLVITDKAWLTPQEMRVFQQSLPWYDFLQQPLGVQEPNGIWRLGSPDSGKVGLFKASTCEGTGRYAWKPVADTTWMEQHQIGNIPALYIQLIQNQLNGQ
ncbi:hypothetical protein CWE08_06295 [Aliidiomarina iranensis]|uniref:Peptidase M10 metallopeptidase domain-containing protein n=1 Tax=Aliidiomarina iranensis TaxID=1434071 RepID=A0A432VWV3_9GAMM|nr:hypothetical protein [Aliidiomarina iranensis]RUO21193.1 hypothetical protein CWE08_06295 [Aliidiomarina iranensis]